MYFFLLTFFFFVNRMINRHVVGRYDDLWGPAVLCVLLVGALIVNFYLRFR